MTVFVHNITLSNLNRIIARKAIVETQKRFPTLTPNGFAASLQEAEAAPCIDVEHTALCIKWIEENMWTSTKPTANKRYTSYGLKHMVERDYNTYVTNGAFICAACSLGADVHIDGLHHNPNPRFNLYMNKGRDVSKEII